MNYSHFSEKGRNAVRECLVGLMLFFVAAFAVSDMKADGLVDATNRFVWSESSGWINFAPENQSVSVAYNGTNRFLTGYIWGENIGYIRLSSSSGGPFLNTTATNWGINLNKSNVLSGFAWGENIGWINFGGSNSVVQIDATNGFLQGYAWGENIGWMRFRSDTNSAVLYGLKVDATGPQVTITSPKSNERLTNLFNISMTGTASDVGVGLATIKYRLNDGSFSNAIGTANWTAPLALVPGTNRVEVKSVDLGGNESDTLSRTFFCVAFSTLTITTNGSGTVISMKGPLGTPTNGAPLEVGRSYTVTAIPAANNIFSNWTGTTISGAAKYVFIMQSNFVLNANFVPNPFIARAGSYNGLFQESSGVKFNSAGFATIAVTSKQGFSGKIMVDGNTVPFSGSILVNGTGTALTKGRTSGMDKPELVVHVEIDLANGTDTLTGTITQPGTSGWTSDLLAYRTVWTANVPDQATAFTNSYTMLLTNDVMGSGYGVVSIDKLGKTTLSGQVADGQPIKQTTVISKLGYWPLFSPLYAQARTNNLSKKITETKGFAFGWLQFTNTGFNHPAPTGEVHWIKTAWTNSTYTAGITNTTDVIGSRWLPPVPLSGARAIAMTNTVLDFSAGDLSNPFSATYFVTTNTTLAVIKPITTSSYPNKITATLAAKTGLLSGTFKHPNNANASIKWFGVMLQDQNYGEGFFMGSTNSGKVTTTVAE